MYVLSQSIKKINFFPMEFFVLFLLLKKSLYITWASFRNDKCQCNQNLKFMHECQVKRDCHLNISGIVKVSWTLTEAGLPT